MSNRHYIVYALFDPRNGELRYIGKSCNGVERAKGYGKPSAYKQERGTLKIEWLKELKDINLKPDYKILQEFNNNEDSLAAEMYWINYFLNEGCNLVNTSKGGVGTPYSDARYAYFKENVWNLARKYDRKAIVDTYLSGKSIEGTAKEYGCAVATVQSSLKEYGVKSRSLQEAKKLPNQMQIQEICKLYKLGKSSRYLGSLYNISNRTVLNYLKINNIQIRSEYGKRRLNPNL